MLKRLTGLPVSRVFTLVLLALLAAYVVWMLSLPAWPSQDGPVHLYYTGVLDALFSHAASPFRDHFFIKHLLPPYAVYYYALLLLSHAMPLLTADRVVICGYMISFVLGFRYAARAIGPNAGITSLLASLLVLNWALGMGFANYCLSLSFGLWAIGLWLRMGRGLPDGDLQIGRRIAFVAVLVMITLTHPVPLLLVLAFCGVDLFCRLVTARRTPRPMKPRELWAGLITLASGSLCLGYVKAFAAAHPLEQRNSYPGTFSEHVARRIKDLFIMKNVEVLYGHAWQVHIYRLSLGLVLVLATVLAVQQWRRNRRAGGWTPADSMLVYAACFATVLPTLPSDLSGAYYFFERLNILPWILMLLAASGWQPSARTQTRDGVQTAVPRRAEIALRYVGLCVVAVTAVLLTIANTALRPLAEHDYRLAHTELPLRGQFIMVLDGAGYHPLLWADPPWDPFFWDTVALLRMNEGIMVNAPWLDSPIIPLAGRDAGAGVAMSPALANSPWLLGTTMDDSPAVRSHILNKTAMAFFSPVGPVVDSVIPGMLSVQRDGWACAPQSQGYLLCARSSAQTGDGVSFTPGGAPHSY